MRTLAIFLALVLPVAGAQALEPIKSEQHQVLYQVDGEFSEIKENLRLAIENQGLVINYVAQVGGMLERTGEDLGFTDHLYSAGDVLEFCSADLTRAMVEADPANLVFCPYAIHVYELNAEPGKIYAGYKRPMAVGSAESRDSLNAIDDLLNTILQEGLAW
jgi:hypothetical protein